MKTKYNSEEQALIIRTFNKVLDDLNTIFEHSEANEIRIPIRYNCIGKDETLFPSGNYLVLNKNGISVEYTYLSPAPITPLEMLSKKGKKVRPFTIEAAELILQEYETIRPAVKKAVAKSIKDKKDKLALFSELDEKYAKEATIEVELPETNNPHTIDVKEEDGKTIGEIKMGYGAIRIITKGPIIINRSEEPKTKKR